MNTEPVVWNWRNTQDNYSIWIYIYEIYGMKGDECTKCNMLVTYETVMEHQNNLILVLFCVCVENTWTIKARENKLKG